MSLKKCPECQGKLSSKANSCPSCGYIQNWMAKKLRLCFAGLAVISFAMLVIGGLAIPFTDNYQWRGPYH